jgi:hypothetical protein
VFIVGLLAIRTLSAQNTPLDVPVFLQLLAELVDELESDVLDKPVFMP